VPAGIGTQTGDRDQRSDVGGRGKTEDGKTRGQRSEVSKIQRTDDGRQKKELGGWEVGMPGSLEARKQRIGGKSAKS
jgi:hypothetical protein